MHQYSGGMRREIRVQDEKVWAVVNYARHAPGNAGNAANIDKHHRQGIFLGAPQGGGRKKQK